MTHPQKYIWQSSAWPKFHWDAAALLKPLGDCRFQQGALLAQMHDLGLEVSQQARAEVLIEEALKTCEIEGEHLEPDSVRSSVAKRLGLPTAGLKTLRDQHAEGVVDILLDATQNYAQPLTDERLFGWHAALFPTGYSGLHKIQVASWRDDANGPMQIVSGPIGREKIHYQAVPAEQVAAAMASLLSGCNDSRQPLDGILRAAILHLWFVAIHPFEDGNGRVARTLTEMAMAQDENLATRYYSLSSQIMAERDSYYAVLEQTNKGDGDITAWLQWFLHCMSQALQNSNALLANVVKKAKFWKYHAQTTLSERQRKVVSRLLEAGAGGFEGGLTNRKYAGIAHVSKATAQRELADLVSKEVLRPNPGGGRSASYDLHWDKLAGDFGLGSGKVS